MEKVLNKLDDLGDKGKEVELFPILQQLFIAKGYDSAEITHGNNEFGKDLVLRRYDSVEGVEKFTSVVVKNRKANNKDFEEGGEIRRQIHTSFNHPFEFGSKQHFMNSVIVVVNGSVTTQAQKILLSGGDIRQYVNVQFWNRTKLAQEIHKHIEEEFLGSKEIQNNIFILRQIEKLKKLDESKKLFGNLPFESIDNLFVEVRTSYRHLIDEENKYKFKSRGKRLKRLKNIDDAELILKSNKNCIIHGIATSGKTLLLKRMGVSALESKQDIAVFYLQLKECAPNGEDGLETILSRQYATLTDGKVFNIEDFKKVLILIDGIEESIQTEKVELFFQKLATFQKSLPETISLQVIVASRTIDVFERLDHFVDYKQIELFPFNMGQAMALVKKIIPNSEQKAKSLIKALKSKQLASSIIRTPMAITLMAILYRDDEVDMEELPANITELYNKFTDYYLNRWDVTKGISLQYKYEELKSILAILAEFMQQKGIDIITGDELLDLLVKVSRDYTYEELQEVPLFIEKLKSGVEVVVYDKNTDTFAFINHSFQEYFASIFFDDSTESNLLDNYFNELWEQSIIFYNGKNPKRDVFLKKAMQSVAATDLRQEYHYLILTTRSLQAANLIGRKTQKEVVNDVIQRFNRFYRNLLEINYRNKSGTTVALNPVIFIWHLRNMFNRMFATKHIHLDDIEEVATEYLAGRYSDTTEDAIKYILAHFLAFKRGSSDYLTLISDISEKNTIWQRLLYVDLKLLNDDEVDEKVLRRLEKKQNRNRNAIIKQMDMPALDVLHRSLIDFD